MIELLCNLIECTLAHQAPLSIEFFRQECCSGLPFPIAGDLPDPGIEHVSLASPALAGKVFITVPPGKPELIYKLTTEGFFMWLPVLYPLVYSPTHFKLVSSSSTPLITILKVNNYSILRICHSKSSLYICIK